MSLSINSRTTFHILGISLFATHKFTFTDSECRKCNKKFVFNENLPQPQHRIFLFLHQFNCISLQFFYHHLSYCCCCSCIRAAGKNEAGKKEIEKNWQERVGNLFCRYFCFYSFLVGYIIYSVNFTVNENSPK